MKTIAEMKAGDRFLFGRDLRVLVSAKPFRADLVTIIMANPRFEKDLTMTVQKTTREYEVV